MQFQLRPDHDHRSTGVPGPEWTAALEALARTVKRRPDLGRFLAALEALGPILARALPHAADDVNELPDALDASEGEGA